MFITSTLSAWPGETPIASGAGLCRKIMAVVAFIAASAMQSGCSVPELAPDSAQASTAWLKAQMPKSVKSTAAPQLPEQVQAALFDLDRARPSEGEDATINVAVESLDAREFFFGVIGDSGANVVVHPDVTGLISLELKDVTLAHVLDVVQELYGYEYRRTGDTYSIFPSMLRTELFQLNYLDIQRVGVTDTNVVGGEPISDGGGASSGVGSQGENAANLLGFIPSSSGTSSESLTPGTRIQTLNRTDLWGSLRAALVALIGGVRDGRAIVVNPQSGVIVVKAFPNELDVIRRFLALSERNLTRQVVLETKILEVELTKSNASGIDWTAVAATLDLAAETVKEIDRTAANFVLQKTTTKSFSNTLAFVIDNLDISELVDLLEQQGTVRVLSSPRISTVNNQKAVIRVGSDEFFVTGVNSTTTTSGDQPTTSQDIDLSPFFSGISLDVTPQIADTGEIILHIHPVVSDVTDQSKTVNLGDEVLNFPLALREVRESDSVVRARSGQLVVLGGLMQESRRERQVDRGPLAEFTPLNFLFRNQSITNKKTELVILMKPQIVNARTSGQN